MPRFVSALVAVVLFCAGVFGQQTARNPRKEQVISEKLAAVAPAAVETFQRGTVALDNGDYAKRFSYFVK